MVITLLLISFFLCLLSDAQKHDSKEQLLNLDIQECSKLSGCLKKQAYITLDANWRWSHNGKYQNCFRDGKWIKEFCPDDNSCAENCVLEGLTTEKYKNTYGITTSRDTLRLNFKTGPAIGSRVYLIDRTKESYMMFKLKNKEFSIDVDSSQLECGMNGAVYFVAMDSKGDKGVLANKAGSPYGTGYCDAQCPHDVKYVKGKANVKGWKKLEFISVGDKGSCCSEMDIWEANKISTAYTPHPCKMKSGSVMCEGINCGDSPAQRYKGLCDKDGCDFNPYRLGDKKFYGVGKKVDTKHKITVVTQFITEDGTDNSNVVEIKRLYVQNGEVISNSMSKINGIKGNSITDNYCDATKRVFGDYNHYSEIGGLRQMDGDFSQGMVLALSLWDDYVARMNWLDSNMPPNADPSKPGVARGSCPADHGHPSYVRKNYPNAYVKFSNIKIGEINSTFNRK